MTSEQLRELIHRLSEEHKGDNDGGFALVAALKLSRNELEPESQARLVEVLVQFVRSQDPEIWAVALEVLVQLGESGEVAKLAGELMHSIQDAGRKDYVVLGLLRMGLDQIQGPVLDHIRSSLQEPRSLTVPIITALSEVDRDLCIEISSEYFEVAPTSDRARSVEKSIPTFVRNFVMNHDQLLPQLVRRVMVRKPEAGRWLATRIVDYLSKPWMIEEIGGERCANLRSKIATAEHALN